MFNTPTQVASSETMNSWDRGCFEPGRQSFPLGIFGEYFPKTETQITWSLVVSLLHTVTGEKQRCL